MYKYKFASKLLEIYFMGEDIFKSLHCNYSIYVIGQVADKNLCPNFVFGLGTSEEIYLIFLFGRVARNEYIRYSYLVICLDRIIFNICIR